MTTLVTSPTTSIAFIEAHIAPLRARLRTHPLYASIRTEEHLRLFMQTHVFAVWDFMSLLKALQSQLTCVTIPWVPSTFPESRRFINEIVLGEESDLFEGNAISHFELYLKAMQQTGADLSTIRDLLAKLPETPVAHALAALPEGPRAFTETTFSQIKTGKVHALASAFTFGREDLIPDMFRALVEELNRRNRGSLDIFIWYLERHIEIDGEDHGPLSLRMVADLCGSNEQHWQEAAAAAEQALLARLALWDAVLAQLQGSSEQR